MSYLSLLGLIIFITAFILSRRRGNSNTLADLGTSDSPKIVKVGGKDLDFAEYLIKYLSIIEIEEEDILTEERAVSFVVRTADKLRHRHFLETGNVLFIDDIPRFCDYVVDELCRREIIPKAITHKW